MYVCVCVNYVFISYMCVCYVCMLCLLIYTGECDEQKCILYQHESMYACIYYVCMYEYVR